MKLLMILAALLMVLVAITLADSMKAEVAEADDADATHDLVGDEHFLKKYNKHYKHAYPVHVHRVYHPSPVYHPAPVYHPVTVYRKKFHKG